jgi:pimeloyl-ACP methyl ester carboxylesterase
MRTWKACTRAQKLSPPPSLVLWGTADSFIPPVHLERWKALLPAARVELLAGVGHFPQDEAGDDVARHLGVFLASLAGAGDRAG